MKTLAEIALLLTLALAVVPSIQTAQANPVPYPMIGMPYEYIYANITVADNGATAKVNGTYPFYNEGYPNVSMSYPLPQDSTNATVMVDGSMTLWKYNEANYSTILGDLPEINWAIDPAPSQFTVEVDYEHAVPVIGPNFTYFYAMGTWKDLTGLYSKRATAYLTADINMESIEENQTLNIYAYQIVPQQQWIWKPQNCIISRIGNTFQVNATVTSDLFHPIEGDFLLTFSVTVSGDINGDFKVSLSDLVLLANAYGSKPNDAKWNPNADIDGNGEVGLSDLVILANHYGQHYP